MPKRITPDIFFEEEDQWNEWGYKIIGENVIKFFTDRKDPESREGEPIHFKDFLNKTEISEEIKNWVRVHFLIQN